MDNPDLKFSEIQNHWFGSYTTSWLGYPEGINQNDYLLFSESDLLEGQSDRHLINAVSNAKRALHMEVESLSNAYGVASTGKKFGSFPQRLFFLSSASFFRKPRLLSNLNRLRNIVEHEYYVPTLAEAENFIDIVDLFINAMQKHRQRYPHQIEMSEAFDDTGNWHITTIDCDLNKGELGLKVLPAGVYRSQARKYIRS